MSTTLGRIPSTQTAILDDTPSQKVQGMLRKIDELNASIKGIAAKIDADTTIGTDYAALWTDSLADLELTG